MKTRLLFIIAAIMLLFGCKKDKALNELKFEITNEEWTIGGTTATLTADYSWSGEIVSIAMEVSEDEGFANANSFEATVSGNSLTVTATGLKAGTTYYYRMRLNTENGKVESDTRTFVTNNPNNPNTLTVNGVSFVMVYVEGGTFDMGATSEQWSDAWDNEYPVHRVTLSDYYIGKYEVTQELWEAVMGSNPSHFKGAQNPVEYVSWNDCQEFVSRLNSLTGRTFRLPTEAEWEYAARGGNKSRHYKYSGSDNIDDVAWYWKNSGDSYLQGTDSDWDLYIIEINNNNCRTHAVGTKTANELGIYDMSGNVLEHCSDWYGDYSAGAQTNPQGPSSGSARVLRGGSWFYYGRNCRVSNRHGNDPNFSSYISGLRLVLVP